MNNYENEISDIKDVFLKHFIARDYFHDSVIRALHFSPLEKQLTLDLSCEREWQAEEKYFDCISNPKYHYRLVFSDCQYCESSFHSNGGLMEYINARFKRSRKLLEVQERNRRKKFYHLRIQVNCEENGYIDIIFRNFELQKSGGITSLRKREKPEWYFDRIRKKYESLAIEKIIAVAKESESPENGWASDYLWSIRHPATIHCVRQREDDVLSIASTVFIIGESGDESDFPFLFQKYGESFDDIMLRRHILDAIEKLQAKTEGVQKLG